MKLLEPKYMKMQKHIDTNKKHGYNACVCFNCRYIAPRGVNTYTTPHIFGDSDTEVNLCTCLQLQLDIMYTANSANTCMQLQTGRHH